MTALEPDEGHSEAITLGLHDASPQHMVDVMADDVVLEMGWGRLIFGQTFADPQQLEPRAYLPRRAAAGALVVVSVRRRHALHAVAPPRQR